MLNMNRLTLIGHAGRDPEIRTRKGGDEAASFRLATTERWKARNGEAARRTEWHRVAEIVVAGPQGRVNVLDRSREATRVGDTADPEGARA